MVLVSFVGGPRDGQHKNYPRNTRNICCADERRAAGKKKGLYKLGKNDTSPFLTAKWVEV